MHSDDVEYISSTGAAGARVGAAVGAVSTTDAASAVSAMSGGSAGGAENTTAKSDFMMNGTTNTINGSTNATAVRPSASASASVDMSNLNRIEDNDEDGEYDLVDVEMHNMTTANPHMSSDTNTQTDANSPFPISPKNPQQKKRHQKQQESTSLLPNEDESIPYPQSQTHPSFTSPPSKLQQPQQPPTPSPLREPSSTESPSRSRSRAQYQQQRQQQQERQQALTNEDASIIQQLDAEYENALIEREIGWNARYISVRQNAGLSLWFMILFLTIGTIFFDYNTEWTLGESLLFSIYTITTVGYGFHTIPTEPSVLFFISVYIFLGIATLTIMAAQLYQWVVLEITWARYEHDKNEFTKRHVRSVRNAHDIEGVGSNGSGGSGPMIDFSREDEGEVRERQSFCAMVMDHAVVFLNQIQNFIKEYSYGQLVVVMVPFWLLIVLGAMVVGTIQGWSFIESLYFSVVSLTTVGFGDFYPSKPASTWFCIIWLPFSVFFVSLYLGSVASFYIGMSDRNVRRIERKLRRRMQRVRTWQEKEREEARMRGVSGGFGFDREGGADMDNADGDDGDMASPSKPSHLQTPRKAPQKTGFTSVDTGSPDSYAGLISPTASQTRREDILVNSGLTSPQKTGETMKTMNDVIVMIKTNMSSSKRSAVNAGSNVLQEDRSAASGAGKNDLLNVQSTVHYNTTRGIAKKPTFALRVLVQERLAYIIAHEVAGYQSKVEIKNNTLSVTIDSLKQTCEKWLVPKRATRSFRAVAFEILYFVGERQLIVRGAKAIFDLRPAEMQGIFGPVLAAMGDAGTMEAWLNRTQMLADTELMPNDGDVDFKLNLIDDRRVNQITQNVTATPNNKRTVIGNAFRNN